MKQEDKELFEQIKIIISEEYRKLALKLQKGFLELEEKNNKMSNDNLRQK